MKTFCILFVALLAVAPAPLLAQTATTTTTTTSSTTTTTTGTSASVGAPVVHPEHEAQLIAIVVAYVRDMRGWPDGSYTVSFDRRDGDKLIFAVDYGRGDTTENLVQADAASFKVLVNSATQKVEQELY